MRRAFFLILFFLFVGCAASKPQIRVGQGSKIRADHPWGCVLFLVDTPHFRVLPEVRAPKKVIGFSKKEYRNVIHFGKKKNSPTIILHNRTGKKVLLELLICDEQMRVQAFFREKLFNFASSEDLKRLFPKKGEFYILVEEVKFGF